MAALTAVMPDSDIRAHAEALFQAWNAHDVDAILEHFTEDVRWIEPLHAPVHGKEDLANLVADNFRAFPDLHLPAADFAVLTSDDPAFYVSTWSATATMTGSSRGLPATGRTATLHALTVAHFRDGLICDNRNTFDSLDFLQQLGVLPSVDGLGFKAMAALTLLAHRGRKLLPR